ERFYEAGFHEVDYTTEGSRDEARRTINAWVEEQTQGKIQDLIQPEDLSHTTRLLLTNAISFKGAWELPFDPDATGPMPFHLAQGRTVDVPTMYQRGDFPTRRTTSSSSWSFPTRADGCPWWSSCPRAVGSRSSRRAWIRTSLPPGSRRGPRRKWRSTCPGLRLRSDSC